MNRVLITGEKGLIGLAIGEKLGTFYSVPKRITGIESFVPSLLLGTTHEIDTVVHTAAKVGGVAANFENKIDFYLENSKLNNIIFEGCYKNGIKNLINFSSTCVFPDDAILPLTEDQIFNGPPHFTNNAYAYSKRMMQMLCGLAREQGMNYFSIVPTNVFGPNDNYNLRNGHVLPSLIHKCYLAKENNEDFVIWGSGNPLREFIYSKDLAKIVSHFIENPCQYDSVIVSNGEEISIRECAELIAKHMEFKGNIVFDTSKPEGQFRKSTDISRLKGLIPDFEFTSFDDALGESINWFVNNYPSVRGV